MTDQTDQIEQTSDPAAVPAEEPSKLVAPIESRFMFVDVAALRAKQLRRGALPRLGADYHEKPHKLERVAMEEVKQGLIDYNVPEWKGPTAPDAV